MDRVILSPGYFPDPTKGTSIAGAQIFVGNVDTDPEIEINQKQVTILQENGDFVEIAQPVLTGVGGVPIYNGSTVTIFVEGNYSLKVLDSLGSQIYYVPSGESTIPVTEFSTAEFIIFDDLDPTKQIDFDASEITTETTRTITMPDSDVDLGDIALKANIESPTFTGIPNAPTAPVDTDTTQLATTAFVLAQIAEGGGLFLPPPFLPIPTASLTAVANTNTYAFDVSGGPVTVTMPTTPTAGDLVPIGDYEGSCSVTNKIIVTSADNIEGLADDYEIRIPNAYRYFMYIDAVEGWKVVAGINFVEAIEILTVGSYGAGSYNLPVGDEWTDYERVVAVMGPNTSTNESCSMEGTREFIADDPTAFVLNLHASISGDTRRLEVKSTGLSSFDIQAISGPVEIRQIKAYKKQ